MNKIPHTIDEDSPLGGFLIRFPKLGSKKIVASKKTRWNEVYPFTQLPSLNQFPGSTGSKGKDIEGAELFSRFTADIIGEDVEFTR